MDAPFIKAIHFNNFKALRDTTLPLGRFTLLVGPNGSGKSTALEGLDFQHLRLRPRSFTAGLPLTPETIVSAELEWGACLPGVLSTNQLRYGSSPERHHKGPQGGLADPPTQARATRATKRLRIYSLDASALASPVKLVPSRELGPKGEGLAVVLDRLRDDHPDRFEAINEEFARWIPEYDRILFDTPTEGERAIKLRTREGHHAIPATDISQGTLLALAILTLAYLPEPPPIVGLEEPDRGLHPRLLRDVRDAMYRLAYPENYGEKRDPVQVIATTHSPYLLDLFRDHPEEIVIANKVEGNVTFTRLSDLPNVNEILADAALGEVWYSGILGGVPADR